MARLETSAHIGGDEEFAQGRVEDEAVYDLEVSELVSGDDEDEQYAGVCVECCEGKT